MALFSWMAKPLRYHLFLQTLCHNSSPLGNFLVALKITLGQKSIVGIHNFYLKVLSCALSVVL